MSRFLAIDAEHGAIHVAAGTVRAGPVRVEKAVTVPVGEALSLANAADLGRQVRDALKAAGVQPGPVVAAVGRDRVIVKDVKIPKVSAAEEPAVVRFQASKDISEAADSIVQDYFTLDREEPDGQVRAVTVSVRKDVLNAYKALCQAAGLKLVALTPRPLGALAALDRAVAAGAVTAPEIRRASVAVLTRGEKWGELVVARDGQAVFSRAVTATALTSEPMLLGELRRNLAVYNGQNPQQPVEALYVVEAAGPGGWSGRIAAGLAIPVQAFDPLAGVAHSTPPEARGHFATLAGLLQLRAKSAQLPIDFVNPRQPVSRDAAKRRIVATAVSLLALVIIGGLGFGYIKVQERQKKLTELVSKKTGYEQDLKVLAEDDKRIKAFKEWDDSRINWLDEMYDLAARFPDVSKIQLEQFRAEPLALQKNVKGKQNVAKIFLKVRTEDGRYMDGLQAALIGDRKYHKVKKDIKAATGFRGGFSQAYELSAEIEKRPPNEYVRRLTVPIPPRPVREDGGDQQFGGGIGGGGFGAFGGPDQ